MLLIWVEKGAVKNLSDDCSTIEMIYAIGREALVNLPDTLCGDLFKRELKLINCDKPRPFFPELAVHSACEAQQRAK
jgi:hypothetical protein